MDLKKFEIDITQYKYIRDISKGGFGVIQLVKNIKTNEYFAAKVLNKQSVSIKDKEKVREIMIMCSLSHPTIVKFIGYSLKDPNGNNQITIIMELYKKGSLRDIIQQETLCLADVAYDNTKKQIILIGISYALRLLHKLRIIHRDLKPENVLLNDKLLPLLSDFGLSKFCQSINQSVVCGTPFYMADEISTKKYDFKVDVFAFGILMIEVICGIPSNTDDFYTKFDNYQLKDELKKLIKSCISKDPKERPTFEEIFQKLSDVDDDNYCLDSIDKYEIINYIDTITEANPICDFSLMKLAVDELFYLDNKKNNEISYLTKNVEQLENDRNRLLNENKLLDERVTRLEKLFKNFKYGIGHSKTQNFDNFEMLLKNSPTIANLLKRTDDLQTKFDQISNKPSQSFSNYETTKNKFQIFNENNVNNVNINNSNNLDSIKSLIKTLQDNIDTLNNDNKKFKQQIDDLTVQMKVIKPSNQQNEDEKFMKSLRSKIESLSQESENHKNKSKNEKQKTVINSSKKEKPSNTVKTSTNHENKTEKTIKKDDNNTDEIKHQPKNTPIQNQRPEQIHQFYEQNNTYEIFLSNPNNNLMSFLTNIQDQMNKLSKENEMLKKQMNNQNNQVFNITKSLEQQLHEAQNQIERMNTNINSHQPIIKTQTSNFLSNNNNNIEPDQSSSCISNDSLTIPKQIRVWRVGKYDGSSILKNVSLYNHDNK